MADPPFSPRQRRGVLAALVSAAVLSGVLAAGAAAAMLWESPADLSQPGQNAAVAQIGLSADGDAVAVWARSNGSNFITQAATKAAGSSSWTTPVDLSQPGQNVNSPRVSVGANGDAVAVWRRSNGSNTIVQAAAKDSASSSWSTPENLSQAGQDANEQEVSVDPDGNALAVWSRSNGSNTIVQAATKAAGSSSWSSAENLSQAGQDASEPEVGMDDDGDAVAVWIRSNGSNTIVQAATKAAASSSWSSAENLSQAGQSAFGPSIAVDADGDAASVWGRSNGSEEIVQAATKAAGSSSWSSAENLSQAGQSAFDQQVAIDAGGEAIAIWDRSNGSNTIVQISTKAAGSSSWGAAEDLSQSGQDATAPQIALDPNGNAVSIWLRSNGSNNIAQAATKLAGSSSWTAAQDLSQSGRNASAPQVAIDFAGDATAVWSRSNGSNTIVQAASGVNPPTFSINPGAEDFGNQAVGSQSPPQAFVVTNASAGKLIISSVSLSGNSSQFALASDCSGSVLLSGQSCTATVVFKPTAAGPQQAQLVFEDSASGSPHQVALSGTGTGSTVVPVLTGLKPARKSLPGLGKPKPLILDFTLTQPAKVSIEIERKFGRDVVSKCKRTTRKNNRSKRCHIYREVWNGQMQGAAGANKFELSAKQVRKLFTPGAYRTTMVATDSAGSSAASRTTFCVSWRKKRPSC